MSEETPRMARDIGVIEHPSERIIVIYRLVPEFDEREQAYVTGGTLTQRIATGRRTYEAFEFGRLARGFLELTQELRAAIEGDLFKRGISLEAA